MNGTVMMFFELFRHVLGREESSWELLPSPTKARQTSTMTNINPMYNTILKCSLSQHHATSSAADVGEMTNEKRDFLDAGEEGGSQKELGKGPGVVDLQRCWGCHEGIRTTWKVGPWHTYFKRGSGAGVWSIQSGCDPSWRRVTGLKRRISANLA